MTVPEHERDRAIPEDRTTDSATAFDVDWMRTASLHALVFQAARVIPALLSRLAAVEREAAELRTENERLGLWINEYKREQEAIIGRALSQLADTQTQLETLRANFAAMHEAHALTVRQKRAAEARLEAAEAATQPRPGGPCGDCSHALNRHAAQEGMCLDCKCFGWCPLVSIATPPVDARSQLAKERTPPQER